LHSLIKLLELVPKQDYTCSNIISYVDYRACEQSRPDTVRPQSASEFKNSREMMFEWGAGIMPFASRIHRLSPDKEWKESVGFDFFQIDQTIFYGMLEHSGMVLAGNFDVEEIGTALSELGYQATSKDNSLLWNNERQNPVDRDNPFVGQDGGFEPIAVNRNYIFNAPTLQGVTDILDATQNYALSIADIPSYRAAANILAGMGLIRECQLICSDQIRDYFFMWPGELTSSQAQKVIKTIKGYGELPDYELVAVADIVKEGKQSATILLIFDSNLIQAALYELQRRIDSYFNEQFWKRLTEQLRNINPHLLENDPTFHAELEPLTIIQDLESGKAAVNISIVRTVPDRKPDEWGRPTNMEYLFRVMVERIYQKEFYWLATSHVLPQF
jgi:hypothetical protein